MSGEGGGERFPKSARLLRRGEFQRTQARGRRRRGAHLIALWIDNGLNRTRFGLTVSRKVGNAVVRNRVKRWLREAIRRERFALTGLDVVFIARGSAAKAGGSALSAEVRHHLRAIAMDQPT